jgi:DNA polymerase-1
VPVDDPNYDVVTGTVVKRFVEILQKHRPYHFAICADVIGDEGGRRLLWPEYKAGRTPPGEGYRRGIAALLDIFIRHRIPIFQADGFEADDFVAALTRRARLLGFRVVILSKDQDLWTLFEDDDPAAVVALDVSTGDIFTSDTCRTKYGVPPSQLTDLMALMGDGDEAPGIAGIGKKHAAELLAQHGTLERVLARPSWEQGAISRKVRAGAEQARMSYELVRLNAAAPVYADLQALVVGWDETDEREIDKAAVKYGVGILRGAGSAPKPEVPRELAERWLAASATIEGEELARVPLWRPGGAPSPAPAAATAAPMAALAAPALSPVPPVSAESALAAPVATVAAPLVAASLSMLPIDPLPMDTWTRHVQTHDGTLWRTPVGRWQLLVGRWARLLPASRPDVEPVYVFVLVSPKFDERWDKADTLFSRCRVRFRGAETEENVLNALVDVYLPGEPPAGLAPPAVHDEPEVEHAADAADGEPTGSGEAPRAGDGGGDDQGGGSGSPVAEIEERVLDSARGGVSRSDAGAGRGGVGEAGDVLRREDQGGDEDAVPAAHGSGPLRDAPAAGVDAYRDDAIAAGQVPKTPPAEVPAPLPEAAPPESADDPERIVTIQPGSSGPGSSGRRERHHLTLAELDEHPWATCGPAAAAGYLGVSLAALRRAFHRQSERRTWTSYTEMREALDLLGARWQPTRTAPTRERPHAVELPSYGLALVQFCGSWDEMPVHHAAQLQRSHWIALRQHPEHGVMVFDVNAVSDAEPGPCGGPGWAPRAAWEAVTVPAIAEDLHADLTRGWWIRAALEVRLPQGWRPPVEDAPAPGAAPTAKAPAAPSLGEPLIVVDPLIAWSHAPAPGAEKHFGNGKQSCHLCIFGGEAEELHTFAQRIGLRRSWAQVPPKASHLHYDLTPSKRREAIEEGALSVTREEIVALWRAEREGPSALHAAMADVYQVRFAQAIERLAQPEPPVGKTSCGKRKGKQVSDLQVGLKFG